LQGPDGEGPKRGGRRLSAWPARILIALLVVAAYAPSLSGEFIGDDERFVELNEAIHDLSLRTPIECFTDPSTVDRAYWRGIYRPIRTLEFAVDWAISGGAPWFFHLRSVLYHVLGAWLALALFRRLLADTGPGVDPRALLGTLFFALHPVQTESVAWITSRSDVLCLCLFLGALLLHMRGRFLAAALVLVAAVFTKESAVVFAGAALVVDLFRKATLRWRWYVLYGAIGVVFTLLWFGLVGKETQHGISQTENWWGGSYPMTVLAMGRGFLYYAKLLALPVGLGFDYHIPTRAFVDVGAVAALVLLIGVAVLMWRSGPPGRLALFWFLITMLPVSNLIVRVGIPTAERFLLLPSVGVAFWFGHLAFRFRLVWVVPVCFLALTFSRCFVWQNEAVFWDEAFKAGSSPRAISVRSEKLIEVALTTRDPADAEKVIENSKLFLELHQKDIHLHPDVAEGVLFFSGNYGGYVLWDRARALLILGRYEEALRFASDAVGIGGPPQAHETAGMALEEMGDLDAAASAYRTALEAGVKSLDLNRKLAGVLLELAQRSESDGRRDEARFLYSESWRYFPDDVENGEARQGMIRLRR
jgi:protein O-mannosyl-transferase